jgi:hypothetical protein
VVVALRLPRRSGRRGPVPALWAVGSAVLVAGVLFEAAPGSWLGTALIAVVAAGLGGLAARWAVRTAWTPRHTLAAAAGALLTYAWHSFPEQPVLAASTAVDLAGNAVFTLGALLLIGMAWRKTAAASTIDIASADR